MRDPPVREIVEEPPGYDAQTDWAATDRLRAVELLALEPGDVVIDVGCGTGLCFADVLARVGRAGWDNVDLVLGSAEDVHIPVQADAALFCFVHDVIRTPAAIDNVVRSLRPGGRVVAVGPMWAPWWAAGLNLVIWYVASQYVTTFEGFDAPWTHLADRVPDLQVERHGIEGIYFAWGALPG